MRCVTLSLAAAVVLIPMAGSAWAQGYPYRSPRAVYGTHLGATHAEAVARIMARHSRNRYRTHPRSLYDAPSYYEPYRYAPQPRSYGSRRPSPYGYRGPAGPITQEYGYWGGGYETRYRY